MDTIKRLARNSGYLFLSGTAAKILSFIALLYIARYLGPEDFGKFSFAFAFIYFFSFIPDLGIHRILVREASKEPQAAGKLIGNGTIMKVFFSLIALALSFFMISVLDFLPETKSALYIASFGLLASGAGAYGIIYEAKLRMEYSLFFNLVSKIFFLSFVLLAVRGHLGLPVFVFSSVLATFVHNFLMVAFSKRLVNVSFEIDPLLMKNLFREAVPVAIASVFSVIYFRIDTLMLSFLQGDLDVGFYSAAYRLTEALVFLPAAFTTSAFPLMSKYFKDSFDSFGFAYARTFKYLFAAGLLAAVLVTFNSDKIILAVYGPEYQNSIIVLQILVWATALMFVNSLVSSTCISSGNQQIISKTAVLATFLNIALNLALIPTMSYTGAALATVFSELAAMAFGMSWIYGNLLHKSLFRETVSPLAAAGAMSLLIIFFRPYAGILFLSALSLPVFAAVLYITGWMDADDKNLFSKLISRSRS
ncbi:flippase [Methanosarcina sp. KYL-1]|uniref:flippase n=1 Tax=Methanosarcina sp. KYL-1 TaxID=2602068 RepID=UPI00210142F4|nr:flippase [Methanosarcina sp. KYL-1]MCQ1535622.1 flippase [Methanosarcina sp. KYL-1]